MSETADIVVVGGGMVGAVVALGAARLGLDVMLVEAQHPVSFESNQAYDLRVSAISAASRNIFSSLGAWRGMQRMRVCPFRRMAVWDGSTGVEARFDSADIGERELGYIVENRVVQVALWQQLEAVSQVEIRCPDRITRLATGANGCEVVLESGAQISCTLVVGADGARSAVRELASIGVQGEQYDQHALVASVTTEIGQQDVTWQRFVESGPQAMLPLLGNHASLVWYHTPERVAELRNLNLGDLREQIELAFPERLGSLSQIDAVGSFPISWSHAESYVLAGLALVGDAAHSVHPLAGQGVNLGMLDAAALLQCLQQAHREGRSIASLRVLRQYERWRRAENGLMIRALDSISKVFEPGGEWKRFGRNLAFRVADSLSPVNRMCMKVAMGLSGDLPHAALAKPPMLNLVE